LDSPKEETAPQQKSTRKVMRHDIEPETNTIKILNIMYTDNLQSCKPP